MRHRGDNGAMRDGSALPRRLRRLDDMCVSSAPVIRIGTQADQIRWLDRRLLIAAWDRLVLPRRCAGAWEARFPELGDPDSR